MVDGRAGDDIIMFIAFRTDASSQIGTGHFMRCLTLANELKKQGAKISFVSRHLPAHLNEMLVEKGMNYVSLNSESTTKSNDELAHSEWLGVSQAQDALETVQVLTDYSLDWIVVDHYALDTRWESIVNKITTKLMVIDDLADRQHNCDFLLDQNWFNNMDTRYDELVSPRCTKLLGPKFALLRPDFSKVRKLLKQRNGKVERLFVFIGGSDPHNLTGMTLHALSEPELTHLKVDVVIGENNSHYHEIKKLTGTRALTYLHVQVDNIASIMGKADLAIGAGGVNTWERMCLRLPALVVSFAENQKILLGDLIKNRYVIYLGSFSDVTVSIIKKGILDRITKSSIKSQQSNDIFQLVTGQGTGKVAKKLMNKFLTISIISDKDSWINDYIPKFTDRIKKNKHSVNWKHDINKVEYGDICFLLSCGQIMSKNIMSRNNTNLVVHESAVPEGKGWSPLTWQILEGKNRIPITLLEVADKIDNGKIYLQDEMVFDGCELIDELRAIQANYTFKLCEKFIDQFPFILDQGKEQKGDSSFYKKRRLKDNEIDVENTILESFNLLRVIDNKRYPAFFTMKGKKYKLQIERYKK